MKELFFTVFAGISRFLLLAVLGYDEPTPEKSDYPERAKDTTFDKKADERIATPASSADRASAMEKQKASDREFWETQS